MRGRGEGSDDGDAAPVMLLGQRQWGHSGLEWVEAMTVASRLLVDLSTLQTSFDFTAIYAALEENDSGTFVILMCCYFFMGRIILSRISLCHVKKSFY